jgi:hypothetical protein
MLRNIFISLRCPAAKIDECVYNIVAGRVRFGLRLLTPEPHCGCLQEKKHSTSRHHEVLDYVDPRPPGRQHERQRRQG